MEKLMPIIVLGAGGHASVVVDAVLCAGRDVIGITDNNAAKINSNVLGIPILGSDDIVFSYSVDQVNLVNGLGSIGKITKRVAVVNRFKMHGYQFANVIHPSAVLAANIVLGEGVQVMAGVIIQTGSSVGANSIVNTKASVDHDCIIGNNVHIAPGVTLSGGVRVDDNVHIGTGAVVIQGVHIGKESLVAAGAVIIRDVPPRSIVKGIPGKISAEPMRGNVSLD